MRRAADTTIALRPALTPDEARRARAWNVRVATWLDEVWGDEADTLPPFTWDTLAAVPGWAVGTPAELERLALLAGALFAAPALRVCLDAGPLIRVRALVGADALDQVLAVPGLPMQAPTWPQDARGERDTLHAWGGTLLVASVGDPLVQATVHRVLDLRSGATDARAVPVSVALRLVRLALGIAQGEGRATARHHPDPEVAR